MCLLSVAAESPAERAGLKPADVLVKLGDAELRSVDDLLRALGAHQPDQLVPVVVRRGGETLTLTVTLGKPQ